MPEEPNCGLELSHVTGINEGRCHANRLLRSARKLLESCPGGEKHTSGSGMFITNVLTSLRDRGAGCRSRHSHRGYQFGPCNNGSWPHGFPGEGFSGVPKSFVHWRRTGVSRTRWVGQPLRSLRGPSPWRSAQLRLRNYSLAQRKIQTSGIAFPIRKLAFCPPGRCLPRTYRRAGLNRETGPSWPRAGKETCQNRSGILLVSYIRNPLRGAHLIFQLWTSPLLMRLS